MSSATKFKLTFGLTLTLNNRSKLAIQQTERNVLIMLAHQVGRDYLTRTCHRGHC